MITPEEKRAWPPRVNNEVLVKRDGSYGFEKFRGKVLRETFEYLSLIEHTATVSELKERVGKLTAALELISGPSEFNCEVGEANQRAAAQAALAADGEG